MRNQTHKRATPTTVHGTRRQRVVTGNGTVLERQAIYLPAETWDALHRLSTKNRRSGSEVIQNLIEIANRGSLTQENKHEQRCTTTDPNRD